MNLRRALVIAAGMLAVAAGSAAAQAPWPQQQQQPQAPWPQQPQQAPWPQQPMQQAPQQLPQQSAQPQNPPCFNDFVKLRSDAEKKAKAIQTASERKQKPTAREACSLFSSFSAAEAKLIKFAVDNAASCGIPTQIVQSMKEAHVKTTGIRTNVCRAAAAPPRPAGPSLSDALSAPVPHSNNIKTGRGTFDTLTGSLLGNR